MNVTIHKTWRFDAAHQLHHHDGKCARPHGHTYTVTVEVTGPVRPMDGGPKGGMVMDFDDLNKVWKRLEPFLDHQDLNHTLEELPATTSEHIAGWLFERFAAELPQGVRLVSVTVSETPTSGATVAA